MEIKSQPLIQQQPVGQIAPPYSNQNSSIDQDDDAQQSSLANCLCTLGAPMTFGLSLCASLVPIQAKTEAVAMHFGKYTGTYKEPGCNFINCFGRDLRIISTAIQTINLPVHKILDVNGNPLQVSAIIVYRIVNTKKAALDVQDSRNFVSLQATATLKQIVSRYPYENGPNNPNGTCLKTEAISIANELRQHLQKQIVQAGAVCESFQLNEIAYAPEIATGMLKRQAAAALVQARELIVQGAVGIALTAVNSLKDGGIEMNESDTANLISNLLVVTCGERDAQPTVSV